ncbi:outer dense fiber protein 2-like [Sceloporus undulatus]|uniref:outer dense fiber protein 2-like n=1 Tax=Sceloporus undulatus TaxID=8520 RepID=UPI001C4B41A9|nr:outer dense fiber protein 2-like [Sceloporus undulatus]
MLCVECFLTFQKLRSDYHCYQSPFQRGILAPLSPKIKLILSALLQLEQTRERAAARERTAQSKILDLETQLSRTKTEMNQLRRNKDDAEHRYQSRLQDLKDRLEQSESTNRSMQNYVHFLKSSYANVFGDSALTSSPIRPRSPL